MRRFALIIGLLLAALPTLSTTAQGCGLSTVRSGLTVQITTGVNLRAAPGLNARDIGGLRVGDRVTLINGPVCVDAIHWWQIGGAIPGWIAESTQTISYMEPAPVTASALYAPLEGLTVQRITTLAALPPDPLDQCPPANGRTSVNYAAVADRFVSGGEAALFVEGGYGTPRPALCIPATQAGAARLIAPNALTSVPQIVALPDTGDYVRATLPESALLLPGVWQLSAGDFMLTIRVIGPFGPLVDVRTGDHGTEAILAGFAPNEQVALLGGDLTDGVASNLRVVTLTTDAQGVAGADLDDSILPLFAAVSQSGLIAAPPDVQSIDLESARSRIAIYDSLVAALWGGEGDSLEGTSPPPVMTPTAAPDTASSPTPTTGAIPTTASGAGTPAAVPTGIVNLGISTVTATPAPATVSPTDACQYSVKSGDTFYKIALANGITTAQLREANPQITNTWVIYVGTVLNIPGCGQGKP